jgi:hypothetical protein
MTRRLAAALIGVLLTWVVPVIAQQTHIEPEAAQARLRSTLRGFYFSLAHRDWNALSQDILPAKIVANKHFPEGLALSSPSARATCSADVADVDQARITFDGDWADVAVPRCAQAAEGTDEFHFIHYQGRWWIVYIALWSARSS